MGSEDDFKAYLKNLKESVAVEDCREVVRILMKLISNLMSNPGEAKYRVVKPENKTIMKLLDKYSNFMEYLRLIGFKATMKDNELKYILDVSDEEPLRVELCLRVLKTFARQNGLDESQIPKVESYSNINFKKSQKTSGFDAYKSTSTSTNATPAKGNGNSVLEDKVQKLRSERKKEMESAGIPTRQLKVYPLMRNFNPNRFKKQDTGNEDTALSDKQLSMRAGAAMIKKNRANEQFRTKAMRDLEKLQKSRVYTELILRIQLPNRWVIETHMSPLETFDDLRKLIIEQVFLSDVYNKLQAPIYFFKTPPKQIYHGEDADKIFDELSLAPASLIYLGFGFVDEKGKVESQLELATSIENLIKPELVVEVKAEDRIKIPKGKKLQVKKLVKSAKFGGGKKGKKNGVKKPKWLKL